MQEQGVNVLLAMPQGDDDETVLDVMRRDFQTVGVTVGRLDLRSSKLLVKQYLEMYQDTSVVIVSQHQTNDSYTPEELDELSLSLEHLLLIPIIDDEEKEGAFVRKLESLGIYSALFGGDSDYETVARLILNNGRTKREARSYYGSDASAYSTLTDGDGYDAKHAVRYLLACGEDYSELEIRLALLSDRLDSGAKMMEVLSCLPAEIFELVSRMDNYRELCRLVREERGRRSDGKDSIQERRGEKRKKDKSFASAGLELSTETQIRQTVDIGFVSTNLGMGCTYSAVMLAHALAAQKNKVAVVEFDDSDEHFENLCRVTKGTMNVDGLTSFSIKGVDYYFHMPYSRFITREKPRYDYVIYDYGCASDAVIQDFFISLTYKFVVTGGADWRLVELSEFVQAVAKHDINNSFIYLVPLADKKDIGNLSGIVRDNLTVAVPYEANPYCPSKQTQRMFTKLLQNRWTQRTTGQEVGIEEKAKRRPPGKRLGIAATAVLISAFSLLTFFITAGFLNKNHVRQLDQALEAYQEVAGNRDSEQERANQLARELDALTITAFSLRQPASAGEVINRSMVDEVTVRSSLVSEFVTADELGMVAAKTDLMPGTPLYKAVVMDPAEAEKEPAAEEPMAEEGAEAQE